MTHHELLTWLCWTANCSTWTGQTSDHHKDIYLMDENVNVWRNHFSIPWIVNAKKCDLCLPSGTMLEFRMKPIRLTGQMLAVAYVFEMNMWTHQITEQSHKTVENCLYIVHMFLSICWCNCLHAFQSSKINVFMPLAGNIVCLSRK